MRRAGWMDEERTLGRGAGLVVHTGARAAAVPVCRIPAHGAGKRPGRALRTRRRGAVEEAAGSEKRFPGEMRPRPGSGRAQGRLRRPAALLRRRRPRHGPRDAAPALHDHPAGTQPRGRNQARVRQRGQPIGDGIPLGLRRRALARHAAASSGRSSTSTAPAAGTSPVPPATARRTSASACRSCRCSTSPRWRAR